MNGRLSVTIRAGVRTRRRAVRRALGLALLPLLLSCGAPGEAPEGAAPPSADAAQTPASAGGDAPPLFVDVAHASGLDFVHHDGRTGALYFVEPVGSGAALADFDGDGDLDAVLVQGGRLGPDGTGSAGTDLGGSRIFRNDLIGPDDPIGAANDAADDRAALHFTDVTEESGLAAPAYGMGVATGDYDDDGRIDLYLTGFGHNQLFHNVSRDGHLRFEDVTARAGVDDERWSTSASFVDVDGDGLLDLFVANYVNFRIATHRDCRSPGGRSDYCGPQSYEGETDRLFRNRGDGTFEDVTAEAGLLEAGSGLGVVSDDFDRDGLPDLYVANDLERNFLWHNLGATADRPRFENVALEAGCAVSMLGQAQASMGIAVGDVDNDGDDDLFMTHLSADTNTFYANDGNGFFSDRSSAIGLGNPSLAGTGFGTAFIDIDNDGWLDVFVANGAVKIIESLVRAGDPFPLKQANQLFANRDGHFVEISDRAGPELERLEVSRGVAVGDVDNDGRSDLLLSNNDGPARLLLNQSRTENAWLGLRVVTRTGRDATGARIEIVRPGEPTLSRRVATDGSYLSARDPRVLVGLGSSPAISEVPIEVRVHWPGGTIEAWSDLRANRYHTLTAGSGESVAEPAGSSRP